MSHLTCFWNQEGSLQDKNNVKKTITNKQENCDTEAKGRVCFEKEMINGIECAEKSNKIKFAK